MTPERKTIEALQNENKELRGLIEVVVSITKLQLNMWEISNDPAIMAQLKTSINEFAAIIEKGKAN